MWNQDKWLEEQRQKELKKVGLATGKWKGTKEKKELKLLDGTKNKLSWRKSK